MPPGDLAPRLVVVTGGGGGIGRALVRRFAGLGDAVVAVGRDPGALDEVVGEVLGEVAGGAASKADEVAGGAASKATNAAGGAASKADEVAGGAASKATGGVRAAICDVTDEDAVARLFEEVGPVDVLVNNAGVSDSAPVERTTLASWHHQLEVNATGPFLCSRAVVPRMKERGWGRVVMVASTAGRAGYPYTCAYTASKHAVVGLVRAMAAELGACGVTVNAVCPAFVDTPMTALSVARVARVTGRSEDESRRALAGLSPLERLLAPDEVADAVVFLASEAAAAVNGQALVLDGGGIQA